MWWVFAVWAVELNHILLPLQAAGISHGPWKHAMPMLLLVFFHAGSGLRTLLWKMTKGRAPADAAQMGPQVPWVQSWQVPGGCVMFNHLTAAVMLELGALAKRGGVEKSWNRGTPLLLVTLYVAWKDQGYHGRNLQHVLVWLQTMWQWVSQLLYPMLPCVCTRFFPQYFVTAIAIHLNPPNPQYLGIETPCQTRRYLQNVAGLTWFNR